MWVKICGTTSLEDAQRAVEAGADAVGFVFAESKRKVLPEQVAPITAALPAGIERVGVFHSQHALPEIVAAAREAGISAIQIHRAYDADTVHTLRRELGPGMKMLQVVTCSVEGVDEQTFLLEMGAALADENLWGILLDAARGGTSGGTGERFDWARVAALLKQIWPGRGSGSGIKLVLAGGLRPENVREAIAVLQPDGVDVVSGVEQSPGKKDAARVSAFISAAR